ncbi:MULTISPECIES: cation diffusion facilitator family transporter [Olivibacter]|uniref:Cation diffusion facilitator family transporter n=1 Tax=Olivibacter jilunii TaxID=985016 RepID=A0ABW6AWG2_9SPHI|nr:MULTISPECIES: cation diffusion facilitator family transporter [unclassified Olivibacter]MCL4639834.1 cation diffusion facilitator family transporter [Olivibacter sp. UJ_SKK_5.1]MDM8175719.1 cation diffusion facilitator family transporter [Olivibacter sp. 47]MDX3914325.1 cation diffusion facilitator family transporter [Pseudosphingobacterium sp.]QEL02453.1 cation transporter [Olivibacter sp. LS-1]
MQEQKRIILYSLSTGIILMLFKFTAYLITHSNAILTDAVESIVNVIASGFAFYSIHLSSQPKDENHPYGHGKVEFFSVFLEGGLIFIAGLLIVGKAVYNIFFPEQISNLLEGMGMLAFTGLVNFALGTYMIKKGKSLYSLTIMADGKHLQVDSYSTLGLLVGLLLLYMTGVQQIDIVLSLGLGFYILFSGYKLLRKSIGGLMDESDFELINQVVQILEENRKDSWIDVHNLRVQRYGHELHIDCHMTLPNYFDLIKVHEEVSQVDALINKKVHIDTELFIHADPCLPACCHYCNMKNCPIRSEEKKVDIVWDAPLVMRNKKHFDV